MPKMQLDQSQPAKVSSKTMAQRKKAKMLKEKAKLEELRKQFPKLFSPEKVKKIEQRNKCLVQPSLKKAVCATSPVPELSKVHRVDAEVSKSDDQENMCENTCNKTPFSSPPPASKNNIANNGTAFVSTPTPAVPLSNSSRVLQVLSSPSPRRGQPQLTSSSRVSILPSCSCSKGQSVVDSRQSVLSAADDVENQTCDICAQIAPLENSRQDVMHALRNFIHKPVAELESVSEKSKEVEEELATDSAHPPAEETSADELVGAEESTEERGRAEDNVEEQMHVHEQEQEDEGGEQPELDKVASLIDTSVTQAQAQAQEKDVKTSAQGESDSPSSSSSSSSSSSDDEISSAFDEEIIDTVPVSSEAVESPPAPTPGCFDQTLLGSLAAGRVRARVVGRKVLGDHVEFVCRVQVLKEGRAFNELRDREDRESESGQDSAASPFCMEMCILRRYSDFEKLHEALVLAGKQAGADVAALQDHFPAKQFFRSFGRRWADPAFLDAREAGLTRWLNESALPVCSGPRLAASTSSSRRKQQSTSVEALHMFISM